MSDIKEIVNQLTTEQKITLIADIGKFSEDFAVKAGLPSFSVVDAAEFAESAGMPAFEEFVNCWDEELVGEYFGNLAAKAREIGKTALVLFDLKPKSTAYSLALTEEPYLIERYLKAAVSAVEEAGLTPILKCGALNASDIRYADKNLDKNAFYNYYYKTLKKFAAGSNVSFLYSGEKGSKYAPSEEYEKLLFGKVPGKNVFVLADKTNEVCEPRDCVNINFGGNGSGLVEAHKTYERLIKDVEAGVCGVRQLKESIKEGFSISDEMINDAFLRAVDYVNTVKERANRSRTLKSAMSEGKERDFFERAARSSLVLLKNDRALPIKKSVKVAVIGELTDGGAENFANLAKSGGVNVAGFCKGYDVQRDVSDELEADAVKLASSSDAVVVFLGLGKTRGEKTEITENARLPANQLALLDRISRVNKRVIAVLCGRYSTDMRFDENCDAVMIAPSCEKYAFSAVVKVLVGNGFSDGRLAYTLYDKTDEYFYGIRADKETGKNKIGPFVGYRSYDANDVVPKYAFGYGANGANVEYSRLKIKRNKVEFFVKNRSRKVFEEVVQVYVGKKDSAMIRPLKELKAYKKVRLFPGKKVKIAFMLTKDAFEYYDVKTNKEVVEDGLYEIYVGSGINDIKLVGNTVAAGSKCAATKENKTEYLQSESNIVSGGYRLRAQKNLDKSHKGAITAGTITIVVSLLLIVAAIVAEVFNRMDIIDFDLFLQDVGGLYLQIIIATVLVVAFIIGIVVVKIAKNKRRTETEYAKIADNFETGYINGSAQPLSLYDKLFAQEFSEEQETEEDEEVIAEDIDEDHAGYFEQNFTLADCKERLYSFINGKGVAVTRDTVAKTLAALNASRFIIWKSEDCALLKKYIGLLSEFFGSPVYEDEVDETYYNANDLFYSESFARRNITDAVAFAAANGHKAVFATLYNVKPSEMNAYFTNLIQYTVNPVKSYEIPVASGEETEKYVSVTPNFWTFVVVSDSGDKGALPQFISETGLTVALSLKENTEAEEFSCESPSYYQMAYLAEKAKSAFALSEELWKRVDRLDATLYARAGLKIQNKTWTVLEKEISFYLAVGGDMKDALDFAVASKIMPAAARVCSQITADDFNLLNTAEEILGDDGAAECKRVIKFEIADIEKTETPTQEELPKEEINEQSAESVEEVTEQTSESVIEETVKEQTPEVTESSKDENSKEN